MTASNHCSGAEPPYCVRLIDDGSICIEYPVNAGESNNSSWLEKCFHPRFVKWCLSFVDDDDEQNGSARTESLALVDLEEYNQLYNELKEKYGLDMVKVMAEKFKQFYAIYNIFILYL